MKANTAKERTHSLFRQGLYRYGAIPTMREDWLQDLIIAFTEIMREPAVFRDVFAPI